MAQLHKKWTDGQVKELIERYLKREIERKYIQEILGIKKRRFFGLVERYREDPDGFSIQYIRRVKVRRIHRSVEENIIKELKTEKQLVENKEVPLRRYNYSYVKDLLTFEWVNDIICKNPNQNLKEYCMITKQLFEQALNIQEPWYLKNIEFSEAGKRLDLYIDFKEDSGWFTFV